MKKQSKKAIPKFKNEAQERLFWETHDLTDYFDMSNPVKVSMPNLKPTTASISIRLSQNVLEKIKAQANKMDVPYQSLMKIWLNEKLDESYRRT
jgi:predicted DNA binding CopG/RHH family protein